MSSIVGIHSHVIATDTRRYPLAPVGPLSDIFKREQTVFVRATAAEHEWIFGKTAPALYPRLAD